MSVGDNYMDDNPPALSLESLGHLNYLQGILTQPREEWEGFYRAQSASMNFALRYQLAFATYALALMATRTPAYRKPYVGAMRAAVERMLQPEVWSYWHLPEGQGASVPFRSGAASGHVAVLVSPHRQGAVGSAPSDPIARDNLQYSGHLSTMLGLYEKVSGDKRYDEPFTLRDPRSGVEFTYTHSEVAARIHTQMRQNSFGGVCCEPGMAYVPCNNYAMASNSLHDALHGTKMSEANGGWLETVRRKMVLRGPAARGVFGTAFMKDLKLATPVAFNFTDAWGLAFLMPFDRELVRKLYRKFRRKVEREGDGTYVGSSPLSERMEISDVAVNTGFGLILARGMGDKRMAQAMESYVRAKFDAGWEGDHYFYRGAPRSLHATALYALAGAIDTSAANFERLFAGSVTEMRDDRPYLIEVADASGTERGVLSELRTPHSAGVGVCRAEYDAEAQVLHIGLRQVGAPESLKAAEPVDVELRVGNVGAGVREFPSGKVPEGVWVEVGGQPYDGELAADVGDEVRFSVRVGRGEITDVAVHSSL
jgi:hypothetical protein